LVCKPTQKKLCVCVAHRQTDPHVTESK